MDVVIWLALGTDLNATLTPDQPLQQAVDTWFKTIGRRMKTPLALWRYLPLPAERRSRAAIALLHEAAGQAIVKAQQSMPDSTQDPRNILEALIRASGDEDSGFSTQDVLGNAATMLVAGEDTTANSMSWLLYYFATRPDIVAQLRHSVDQLTDSGGPVDPDLFRRLPFVQAACIEALRLKPVAPMIGLMATEPIRIAGLQLRAGQLLTLLPRVANQATPDHPGGVFDVARWAGQADMAINPLSDHFAFGGGPRSCPGRYLAMIEMMSVAVMTLRSFNLTLAVDAAQVQEKFTFTMGPDALPMRISRRGDRVA